MKNTGQELWKKAKRIIPGGNQLFSKRVERFLPGLWPAYYERAKGCEVWDLDGNHYYDFAQMGVGTCILGYADPDVNAAVKRAVDNGSMCTLNCREEVEYAERLLALHPWAEMARFGRTGGEACAIAVRIARAAVGKSAVAFCGYHGWQDWYLAANLGSTTNLDGQLLPGLEPKGVPRELTGTALPFSYNRPEELDELVRVQGERIGVIMMEPRRADPPAPGFLQHVRDVADRIGAVLIFDEVTSGFRVNTGGIHLTLGVEPDIAVFGKCLGNGYPISAVIGRRAVMESAQDTFISSSMWTERVGYAAALATLDKVQALDATSQLVAHGLRIGEGWLRLAGKHGLAVKVGGLPPLTSLRFEHPDALALQTLYAQEMLDKGYLVGAAVYTSLAYTPEIIDRYLSDTDQAFAVLKDAITSGNIHDTLRGEVIHAGFKRLA